MNDAASRPSLSIGKLILVPAVATVDADCIRQVAEQVVKVAADEGNCVIVGRGFAYYLQDRLSRQNRKFLF